MVWSRLLVIVCLGAYAQSTEKLEFEVASVKPSPPPDGRGIMMRCNGGPGTEDPGMFICENMSLANLVTIAYKISYYQLASPDWMQGMGAMFQVSCKVPEGSTREQFTVMLQNFLADRFKLVLHRETRDYTTYQLVVAKNGPKFKEAGEPPPPSDDSDRPLKFDKDGYPTLESIPNGIAMSKGRARMHFPQMTMQMLANRLSPQVRGPVTDSTGLTGKYDISLYWVNRLIGADSDIDGPTLIQALQEQLGLRLESKKAPLEFLVVDHAEKVPTEN